MSHELAISARGLGKRYTRQVGVRSDSLRDAMKNGVKAILRGGRPGAQQTFWALKDANFDIARGENVGLVGLNGAGKSTLLKVLSRITTPTTGSARVTGRMGALLEVGTGFHGELTGRENTFLYGAILGMSRAEVARKFDAIVDFAEIGQFIDMPVKRYSSGMYVRLAFAVAAHLDPEILLLDEVLAVGDITFQRKCIDFARGLQKKDATILFVSHNMFSIKTMCDRVIYLRNGQIVFDGPTEDGIKLYEDECSLHTLPWLEGSPDSWPIIMTGVEFLGEDGAPRNIFDFGERMTVRLRYKARQPVSAPNFTLGFDRSDGVHCCTFSTEADGVVIQEADGEGVLEMTTPPLSLISDMYTINFVVRKRGYQDIICAQIAGTVHIRHPLYSTHFGVYHEPARWRIEQGEKAQARVAS